MAPMEFEKVFSQIKDKTLRKEVDKLLVKKRAGDELSSGPVVPAINNYLKEKINYYKEYVKSINKKVIVDNSILDQLFRDTLKKVFNYSA